MPGTLVPQAIPAPAQAGTHRQGKSGRIEPCQSPIVGDRATTRPESALPSPACTEPRLRLRGGLVADVLTRPGAVGRSEVGRSETVLYARV